MNTLFANDPATAAPPIKILSLWQPWASLMAAGVKLHETRHWPTNHRGQIAIHAAKKMDWASAPDELCDAVFGKFWMNDLPRGVVLGVGNLTECRKAETVAGHLTAADLISGNFARGRYAWRVEDFRRLHEPIPLIGRQGVFNWTPPAELESLLGPAMNHGVVCRRFKLAA